MDSPTADAPPVRPARGGPTGAGRAAGRTSSGRRSSSTGQNRRGRPRTRLQRAGRLVRQALEIRVVRRALLALGAAAAALMLLAALERAAFSGDVLPEVEVEGVDVGGKGERDAYADIADLAARLEVDPIRARAGDVELSADPSLLGLEVDEDATLRAARRAGRSRNPLDAVVGTVLRRFRSDRVELELTWSGSGLEGVLDGWEEQVRQGTQEAGLRFEGTEVVVVDPRAGTGILRDEARERLVALLDGPHRRPVELPVGRVEPRVSRAEAERAAAEARELLSGNFEIVADGTTIVVTPQHLAGAMGTRIDDDRLDLTIDPVLLAAAIADQLDPITVEPVEAGFEVTPDLRVTVTPSSAGVQIDMEKVAAAILRGERRIEAPLREVEPEHDTEWAEKLGIIELVSQFTTRYPSGQPRVTNIHVAADYINNTIVEPGEVFSLNEAIGPRTAERGFVQAPVYYGEQEGFTEDFGGGVSQLATTTFNAVFWGGYEDVTHKPHSIYFTRYPMGREATVNYPSLDLQFRNNSRYGVLVRTFYDASSITVMFFGNKDGKVVREESEGCSSTDPNSRCVDIITEYPIETRIVQCPVTNAEDDPDNECADLEAGEQKKIDSGHTGYAVQFWRVMEQPGQEPVREKFYWRYRMLPDVVLVGDPNATTTTASTAPPSTTTPATTAPATTTTPTTAAPTTAPAPTTTQPPATTAAP